MFNFLKRRTYHTLNTIYIDKLALKHNHAVLSKYHPEAKVCPVLKSNAYGHGLTVAGKVFDTLNAPFLVVDSLYEAYELYKEHVKTPILIMGYTNPKNFKTKKLPFTYVVYDLALARTLNQYQPGAYVHLFVDTGMSREGIPIDIFRRFIREMKKLKNLKITGLASHLADADNPRALKSVEDQVTVFKAARKILQEEGIEVEWRHISASGGAFKVKDKAFNMIRAGLASYGINPLEKSDAFYKRLTLRPALSFTSTLVEVKRVKIGSKIGYNGTYTAQKDMTIGIIPAGYYEGVHRGLSNAGVVRIGRVYCPIIGRVSMNIATIDISGLTRPKVGDEVLVYSDIEGDRNTVFNSAEAANTIPYELLVHIAESVKRRLK